MTKSAVISTGNKQYHVKVGDVIEVEKLASSGKEVVFDQVLLVIDGDNVSIGTPTVSDTKVYGSLETEVRGEKIQVFRYKSKSRYRKMKGHRQTYTQVKIESIGEPAKKSSTPEKKAVVKKPVVKKPAVKKSAVKKPAVKKSPAKK